MIGFSWAKSMREFVELINRLIRWNGLSAELDISGQQFRNPWLEASHCIDQMGLGFHLASKPLEWREKRRNGSAKSLLQWPAKNGPGWLQERHYRGGRSRRTAAARAWERGREKHGHRHRLGEKERVGSRAKEGISRRKWAPQPSQNWLKTAQFSESGTAGH